MATGFFDNFNDNSQDTALWDVNTIHDTFDSLVTVAETNQELEITTRGGQAGNHYNGYVTHNAFDMTGCVCSVQLVATASAGDSDTTFCWIIDANNSYAFIVETGVIYFQKKEGGANSNTSATYSATTHKWLRLRHDKAADTINWDTSTDGVTWTNRRSLARSLTITAMKAEMSAGTYKSETSSTAKFDDFLLRKSAGMPLALLAGGLNGAEF